MQSINQKFTVNYNYTVHFTSGIFTSGNPLLKDIIKSSEGLLPKLLFVIDQGVVSHHPHLIDNIKKYAEKHSSFFKLTDLLVVPGGEPVKNDPVWVDKIVKAVNDFGIDRQSYIAAIGGGALLDMAGYASTISHRGVRHIRIPTTVLSQNDSGIGVKNSVNAFNKKNFLGTFSPPYAVVNDFNFLTSLDDRNWRAGISEAIKVALIRDASFFEFIKKNLHNLVVRDQDAMKELIYKCAKMHMDHIAGGDPFEQGSSRPLDFGHWAAHKLEQISAYTILHGEAVAFGIALDSYYSFLSGRLKESELEEILNLLLGLGFEIYSPFLTEYIDNDNHPKNIIKGLQEFREHLGGKLTIMLLDKIGKGVEVHEMDAALIKRSLKMLEAFQKSGLTAKV